ncbi:glucosaminidase domain-containing protein [candidate division WWE3 bacterium]|nr:glucosaminidase domain-containing protein [candidate division WWE3 bacterium]
MPKALKVFNSIFVPITLVILVGFKPIELQKTTTKNMQYEIGYKRVDRVEALEKFLTKYHSPLKGNAKTFVEVADKYGIDYKLLPAIACMESTCGKALIEGTYNPFGWGIYGNSYIAFDSYDHAIEIVGKGIHKNYISKGFDTIVEIAPIYTPPNSKNWARGVQWFSNEIDSSADKI